MSAPVLLPGATLGVMGGGQLGRMFVHAAQVLGYRTVVLEPDATSPAGLVAHQHVATGYTDAAGLAELASVCDAVTTEFENVPADSLRTLAERLPVAPAAAAVEICQDRAAEKRHFQRAGVPCAPFATIEAEADLAGAAGLLPGILKTARLGYDGKGQVSVSTPAELAAAWQRLGRAACVLEKRLPLALELSVIVARGRDGTIVSLPLQQNLHRDGILAVTQVPAPEVRPALAAEAVGCAGRLAASMDYVGVLCVEFFVLADGSLVANEMAPRPHNSGHYSLDACDVSQFELQLRTLAGLPLVAPRLHSAAVMMNLLGDLWFPGDATEPRTPDWGGVLALPGVALHLYGKTEARRGRKMGHLTVTAADASSARTTALEVCRLLGLAAY
ncbi:5-(carboxyamino)imidazole ribonucleotide synthase [Rubrivivax gelatinosus]|uniref:5-(carboxyamino)imidazole ribonucleotide synthase n=1 Tax=Rubrivivax gelatinosus TaxID=28068 RepID=UPI001902C38E|nr:5-(carboxyamino)imidazole ribonucleotide synthase [Rubrivivax gelatinosus]